MELCAKIEEEPKYFWHRLRIVVKETVNLNKIKIKFGGNISSIRLQVDVVMKYWIYKSGRDNQPNI